MIENFILTYPNIAISGLTFFISGVVFYLAILLKPKYLPAPLYSDPSGKCPKKDKHCTHLTDDPRCESNMDNKGKIYECCKCKKTWDIETKFWWDHRYAA